MTAVKTILALACATTVLALTGLTPLLASGESAKAKIQRLTGTGAESALPRFTPKLPAPVDEFTALAELKPIHFAFDKAEIRAADAKTLDASAEWLKANPQYPILIAGYADERGTEPYNLALAERRAQALRDQLVARGVLADRISLVAYGEVRPACRAKAEACWGQNRHADILVRLTPIQTP